MSVRVAVLAGGAGSRIGGDKALVPLGGRPLITYPVQAARAAGLDVVVVAKRASRLPELGVPVLLEPDVPSHPALGVITALGELPAVIALPCDMPFVTAADLAALAVVPDDLATLWRDHPFPSLYRAAALARLWATLEANRSMRSLHTRSPCVHAASSSADRATLTSINTPEDVAAAEERLRAR